MNDLKDIARMLCASLVVATLVCLGNVSTARAQSEGWASNGPEGGYIAVLAIDPRTPTTVYAGTSGGGIFKSTDGGASWSAINSGLPLPYPTVQALAIHPQASDTLYAGTNGLSVGGNRFNTGTPSNTVVGVTVKK